MRAVMLEVPEWFLEDRRRKGHDKRDEVWEGVLHMVPPPSYQHNAVGRDLLFLLHRFGKRLGLEAIYEPGFFDPVQGVNNYRIPDLALIPPERVSKRGIEGGAALLVEILSPNDESRDKLPFYARHAVSEVWLVEPVARAIEIYALRGGNLVLVPPQAGRHRSPLLGIELATIAGPKLAVYDGEHTDEI